MNAALLPTWLAVTFLVMCGIVIVVCIASIVIEVVCSILDWWHAL